MGAVLSEMKQVVLREAGDQGVVVIVSSRGT
jgi:hypothetical protein